MREVRFEFDDYSVNFDHGIIYQSTEKICWNSRQYGGRAIKLRSLTNVPTEPQRAGHDKRIAPSTQLFRAGNDISKPPIECLVGAPSRYPRSWYLLDDHSFHALLHSVITSSMSEKSVSFPSGGFDNSFSLTALRPYTIAIYTRSLLLYTVTACSCRSMLSNSTCRISHAAILSSISVPGLSLISRGQDTIARIACCT